MMMVLKIQRIIVFEYATLTSLIKTVMDSDRIMVMEQGHVAELDTPRALLQIQGGLLRGMVDATGEASAHSLEALAVKAPSPPGSRHSVHDA